LGHRQETSPTATRLRPVRSRPRTWLRPQRRWRCFHFPTRTQGRRWARQPWAEGRNPFGIVCTRTRFDFVTLPCYRESQRDSVSKPRVARHELSWVIGKKPAQPQREMGRASCSGAPGFRHNAVGVVSTSQRAPKVGAGRANLGLKDAIPLGLFAHERDSISSRCLAIENPNGIPSQSPGLRGTSYPGSSARNLPNRNAVATRAFRPRTWARPQRRWRCGSFRTPTQGRSRRANLRLIDAILWDWQTRTRLTILSTCHNPFPPFTFISSSPPKTVVRFCATNPRATRSTRISAVSRNNWIVRPSSPGEWKTTCICSRDSGAPSRRQNG